MQLLTEFVMNILYFLFSFLKFQIWDIGGQPRFRSMWERYCRGVNAIVWALWFDCNQLHFKRVVFTANACMLLRAAAGFRYMVDAADQDKVEASRNELHNLLDKPQLQGIPVSVDPKLCLFFFLLFFLHKFCCSKWAVGTAAFCSLRPRLSCVFRFWFSETKGISPLL